MLHRKVSIIVSTLLISIGLFMWAGTSGLDAIRATVHLSMPSIVIIPEASASEIIDADGEETVPSEASMGDSDSTKLVPPVPSVIQPASPASVQPTRLSIPAIGVNTKIIPLGVTSEGNLDVPDNYVEVGWYKDGVRPGNTGSAVLDGHVDNGASIDGPFKRLRELEAGDDIYVKDKNGAVVHFVVRGSTVYDYKKFPSDSIFNDKSGKLLKIITCHGTFLSGEKTYDKRLVVTAIRVD